MTLCHVTWILFLEPFTECAQSVRIRTDTTLDSGLCTESNCAGMYTMHGRVSVDNMYEFQHSFLSGRLHLLMQDSRAKRGRKHVCQLKAFKLAHDPSQPGPEKASAFPVILARLWALDWALKVVRQIGRSVSIHEMSHCLLLLLCSLLLRCPCFAHCCHDPFSVRSALNSSTFFGFTQSVHPSRCSRSALTTVCF